MHDPSFQIFLAKWDTAVDLRCVATMQEFVKETYFNSERELVNDQASEIVEQKERIISVTQPDPCSCVTGTEYGISYSGIPRSRRGSRADYF